MYDKHISFSLLASYFEVLVFYGKLKSLNFSQTNLEIVVLVAATQIVNFTMSIRYFQHLNLKLCWLWNKAVIFTWVSIGWIDRINFIIDSTVMTNLYTSGHHHWLSAIGNDGSLTHSKPSLFSCKHFKEAFFSLYLPLPQPTWHTHTLTSLSSLISAAGFGETLSLESNWLFRPAVRESHLLIWSHLNAERAGKRWLCHSWRSLTQTLNRSCCS